MHRSPTDYLRHILDEIAYTQMALASSTREAFLADPTLQRDIVRSLEIIGEATKNLPADFRNRYPDVPWRDRLIHGYFGIDYAIVWDAIAQALPLLKPQLTRILEIESGEKS